MVTCLADFASRKNSLQRITNRKIVLKSVENHGIFDWQTKAAS